MSREIEVDSKCTTIFMSQELLQANVSSLGDENEVAIPDVSLDISTYRPGKLQHPCHKVPGVCRSFACTDLLHDVHSSAHADHSRSSVGSLEGALQTHADHAVKSPGGETGNNSQRRKTEEEEMWEDARESGAQVEEESFGSVTEQEEEETEEGDVSSPPITGAQTNSEKDKQAFHCLPKSLVPAEITHCLFELEKECRGVERESDSVKWKMEMVHRSVQTVQETLRTLLTHLVEAQSFNNHNSKSPNCPTPANSTTLTTTNLPTVITPAHLALGPLPHPSAHSSPPHPSVLPGVHPTPHLHPHPHPHPHCQAAHAVARRPSETCLTQPVHPHLEPCCPDLLAEPPSCAQRRREKAAAFHILTELRESVEQLLVAQKQECKEHREVLALLREMRPLQNQDQSERAYEHGISTQLDDLHQQASQITELARQAVSVFSRVAVQLEALGAVVREAAPEPTHFNTMSHQNVEAIESPLLCQRCQAEISQISQSEV